ncbi:EpsG family protein [Pectobacterium carotovorum subsp. carotovorum]|uniref:EpsG family protein n=1 Tax=Pectobacterium carotovorum TaxID=554 RepID=UPI00202D4A9B|nr:EpsG family protein [Pectobacterium carotovorum]MCL6331923.1 EpsG family protein [Pectobacterium carotovorum subsp. carotovorum]
MPLFLKNPVLLLFFSISISFLFISFVSIITKSKRLDNVNFFSIIIMMLVFYGFRYPGTTDTIMYLSYFDGLSNFSSFPWGIGFFYLMGSIKEINFSHEGYVFYSSLYFVIAMAVVVLLFCKNTYYKSLFMLSNFYSWSLLDLATNTYRQGIAIPFVLLSLYFLKEKKFIFSFFCSAIAASMHWSSLVIVCLVYFSYVISNRIATLKYISLIALSLLSISFFINFSFAEILSKSALLGSLQNLFLGVDLLSKVDAYLGGGVDGASFYDMASYQRIYYTAEIYVALVVCTIFFCLLRKDTILAYDSGYRIVYSFFIIITSYGILLISMTWFIRNFYWAAPIAPLIYIYILRMMEENSVKKHKILLFAYCVFILFFSCLTFWRLPLLNMSYPTY